jgi:hypothetical protein
MSVMDNLEQNIRLIIEERNREAKARGRAELRVRAYAEVMASLAHQLATATKQKPETLIRKAQSEVTERLREYEEGWMEW